MNDAVTAAWDKVVEDWENQARHDALLQLTMQHDALRWVAGQYRQRKGDAIADAQLAKLANAAMATMFASGAAKRGTETASPYKRALVWLVVLVVMLAFGLIAAKVVVATHHAPRP